jgi:hypothetical protein
MKYDSSLARSISRRRFLGGAAVAISLPPFESLLEKAYAQAGTRRQRLLTIFVPNGSVMADWVPAATGTGFTLSAMMTPFAKVKSKLLVLSNVANLPGEPGGNGDHAGGTGAAFTAVTPARADGAGIRCGISLDQVAANVLKAHTRTPSLQLGVQDGRNNGACEFQFSCVYENTISWADERHPLTQSTNPAAVFETLFAGLDPAVSAEARAMRQARRKSILDFVRTETAALIPRLGASDRPKLDELVTGIRDLERRIEVSPPVAGACGPPARPPQMVTDIPTRSRLMNELIATAFKCDATRVISHMIAPSFPGRSYAFMGVATDHHGCSHFSKPDDLDKYRKIQLWHLAQVADLLERLDAIPEESGTVLDNTFVIQTSDCGESRNHDHRHLPVLVAGGGGVFKMGRHLALPPRTPIANLFLSVLNGLGIPATTFGQDGTAPLTLS